MIFSKKYAYYAHKVLTGQKNGGITEAQEERAV
jgi:hypothetical protein